ncbi:MAG: hypothetical protein U0T11_08920 [Chitinophagaceae bacterium]
MIQKFVFLSVFACLSVIGYSQEISTRFTQTAVIVEWNDSTFASVDHYEIERRTASTEFATIGLLLPDPTTGISVFSFKDKLTGGDERLYYRIRSFLTNGEVRESIITPVSLKDVQEGLVTITKSVQSDKVLLELPAANGSYVYRFYSVGGRLMTTGQSKADQTEVAVNDLPKGDYFVEAFHPQSGKRFYGHFTK